MYPAVGFTKGQVIDFYTRIAPGLLPHLREHPLTLKLYPNGVAGSNFYETNGHEHRLEWVRTRQMLIWDRRINFCVYDDQPALVWAANLADLELHPSVSLAEANE